jgi:uncharacterized protein (TIGR03435 family)
VERRVEDQTGLTGTFALDLRWRSEQSVPDTNAADELPTSIFTALQEQLGLELEPKTAMREVLVVDHVERPASD